MIRAGHNNQFGGHSCVNEPASVIDIFVNEEVECTHSDEGGR